MDLDSLCDRGWFGCGFKTETLLFLVMGAAAGGYGAPELLCPEPRDSHGHSICLAQGHAPIMSRNRGNVLEDPRAPSTGRAAQGQATFAIKKIERVFAPIDACKLAEVLLVDRVSLDHGRNRLKGRPPSDFA